MRIIALALLTVVGIASLVTTAVTQPAPKQVTVGIFSPAGREPWPGFITALRELGYQQDRNLKIEYRSAKGLKEELPKLAAELVSLKPDVIVASGTPSVQALKKVTALIPIIMGSSGDPVGFGLVDSLAHPGGDITGTDATLTTELDAKRLELLHELLPTIHSVAVLVNPNRPGSEGQTKQLQAAAHDLGMDMVVLSASHEAEIDTAFTKLVHQGLKALLVGSDPFFASRRDQLITLAARHSVPCIYQWPEFVTAGGLMSYGLALQTPIGKLVNIRAVFSRGPNPPICPWQGSLSSNF